MQSARFQGTSPSLNMSPTLSVADSLSPNDRQDIAVQMLSHSQPISHQATMNQVSRKLVYQQGDKAQQAHNKLRLDVFLKGNGGSDETADPSHL